MPAPNELPEAVMPKLPDALRRDVERVAEYHPSLTSHDIIDGIRAYAQAAILADRESRAAGEGREGAEGVYAPRYVCDGPEGMFGTDDEALARRAIDYLARDPDDWTMTDTHDPDIAQEPAAMGAGQEGCDG